MEPISIRSNQNTIVMLDSICQYDKESITAERQFNAAPRFSVFEAGAQLCALHVRWISQFSRHAFLLSMAKVDPLPPFTIEGPGIFKARLKSVSKRAFAYQIAVNLAQRLDIKISLTIGTKRYGDGFEQSRLLRHYQSLFNSLKRENIP